ncbi:putative F-box/FBD/LRR-repeat protein At4g03220 isoform X1 [Rhododendron vialii]|uniref:putative F-box/FBD/LRR-repeat protein At4g03220 isoform X1 n=1 Tax=Rhododendron vialii TaxID=182163 RepID=UPI00265F29A8|nr:putative F-box/FBD/LRR-repeat protein At4g03220 isoform X1 [Rhododendron vialii]
MATRISQKKEGLNPNAENKPKKKKRITRHTNNDLPDEILHHIFSFLPFKPLAQTTVLSKNWNHLPLWRSHPHLDFSNLSPNAIELVPTLLSRRQPHSNITAFRLSGCVSSSCLRDCIDRVMKQGIEQLELDVHFEDSFDLPSSLFSCDTLRVLTLNHQNKGQTENGARQARQAFRGFTPFPSVHTLSLSNVRLNCGRDLFSGKNFPLLRKLGLKNCGGISGLLIKCPGLEILEIDRLRLSGLDISGIGLLELRITKCFQYVNSWANILAPSLQSLYWEGKVSVKFTVESFRVLKTFSLWFYYKVPNRATWQSVSTLLSAICFVRSMTFVGSGSRVLETLSKIDSEGGLPCSFNNLITLELHPRMTKDEITGIICLLRSSPILRTITITANSCSHPGNEKWNEKQYWISQIQKLKSIEFQLKVARSNVCGSKMHKSAV